MQHSPLDEWHKQHGARMVDFAGWSMPVLYSTIVEEHHAVRKRAGLFDVSHMGRLRIDGPGAVECVERLVTCSVANLAEGRIRYGLVTNESGGILDDILVYRVGSSQVDLVVNASNREKIVDWIKTHHTDCDAQLANAQRTSVQLTDVTLDTCMLALQGPRAAEWLGEHCEFPLADLGYYRFVDTTAFGMPVRLSRTGYTGEDGFELIAPADQATALADHLLALDSTGEDGQGVAPCGLGCRDTLRLEAGMPLYGHELDETIDPIAAGLGFAVAKNKPFLGSDAIAQIRADGPRTRRVGLRLEGRRIARQGTPVLLGGETVGHVTSGTLSPTLDASIAMASIDASASAVGTELSVDMKGKPLAAVVVDLPFYRRENSTRS